MAKKTSNRKPHPKKKQTARPDPKKKPRITKMKFPVMGIEYRLSPSSWRLIASAAEENPLQAFLEREPSNSQDPNAIRIVLDEEPWTGLHIGYVPREYAAGLAGKLDKRMVYIDSARLVNADPENPQAKLELRLGKPRQN